MSENKIKSLLKSLIDELASVEHERWSHWQKYMHGKCKKNRDGSLVIPSDLVKRWEKQIYTSYSDLSADEKCSDQEQVLRYLPIIEKALRKKFRCE